MSTAVTLTGRLGADPEIRFTPSGKAVTSFNVVTDRRQKNKETDEWESFDTTWWRCTAWEALAETVTETFRKGDAVIVVGRTHLAEYEKDGEQRKSLEVQVFHCGVNLKFRKPKERQQTSEAWDTPEKPPC